MINPYVTEAELAKQLAYRDIADPKLEVICEAATLAIDSWCGRTTAFDPIPAMVRTVALSLAVDLWKQADATFGMIGMGETGPVRIARDLVARYDSLLVPHYDGMNAWGIA